MIPANQGGRLDTIPGTVYLLAFNTNVSVIMFYKEVKDGQDGARSCTRLSTSCDAAR